MALREAGSNELRPDAMPLLGWQHGQRREAESTRRPARDRHRTERDVADDRVVDRRDEPDGQPAVHSQTIDEPGLGVGRERRGVHRADRGAVRGFFGPDLHRASNTAPRPGIVAISGRYEVAGNMAR